jgi:hypothetical protein
MEHRIPLLDDAELAVVRDALLSSHTSNRLAIESMERGTIADQHASARLNALCRLRVAKLEKVLERMGVKP